MLDAQKLKPNRRYNLLRNSIQRHSIRPVISFPARHEKSKPRQRSVSFIHGLMDRILCVHPETATHTGRRRSVHRIGSYNTAQQWSLTSGTCRFTSFTRRVQ